MTRSEVGKGIGWAGYVIMTGDVSMETLMEAEKAKQVGRDMASRSSSLALPEESGKVVGFTEYCSFPCVVGLGKSLKMKKPTSKLQI